MSKVLVTDQHLTDIADAIRSKLKVDNTYLPSEMAQAVLSISKEGSDIFSGSDDPVDDLGNDGSIYFKYKKFSYIQTTAQQRIQLDYVYQLNSRLECICKMYRNGKNYPILFGCQSDASRWVFCYYHNTYRSMYVMGQNTEYSAGDSSAIYDNDKTVKVVATNGHIEVYDEDGVSLYNKNVTAGTTAGNPSYPLMLFQRHGLPSSCEGTVILYDLKIYEDDTLVRHYIPSYESDKYCLYDEFTKTYFHSINGDLLGSLGKEIDTVYIKIGGTWKNVIGSNIDDIIV